jgi:hypothetical protein
MNLKQFLDTFLKLFVSRGKREHDYVKRILKINFSVVFFRGERKRGYTLGAG